MTELTPTTKVDVHVLLMNNDYYLEYIWFLLESSDDINQLLHDKIQTIYVTLWQSVNAYLVIHLCHVHYMDFMTQNVDMNRLCEESVNIKQFIVHCLSIILWDRLLIGVHNDNIYGKDNTNILKFYKCSDTRIAQMAVLNTLQESKVQEFLADNFGYQLTVGLFLHHTLKMTCLGHGNEMT